MDQKIGALKEIDKSRGSEKEYYCEEIHSGIHRIFFERLLSYKTEKDKVFLVHYTDFHCSFFG